MALSHARGTDINSIIHCQLDPCSEGGHSVFITPKMHDLKPRHRFSNLKLLFLQVHIIEFSIMEPPAIKRGAEENATAERTARRINTEQLNTLTSTAVERPPDEPSYAL